MQCPVRVAHHDAAHARDARRDGETLADGLLHLDDI